MDLHKYLLEIILFMHMPKLLLLHSVQASLFPQSPSLNK